MFKYNELQNIFRKLREWDCNTLIRGKPKKKKKLDEGRRRRGDTFKKGVCGIDKVAEISVFYQKKFRKTFFLNNGNIYHKQV